MIKKILSGIIFSFCFLSQVQAMDTELFVGQEDINLNVQEQVYSYSGSPLFLGGSFLYSKEDEHMWVLEPYMTVEDIYKKALNLGLGFEMVLGTYDNTDYDICSLGFLLKGEYDFSVHTPKVPLTLEGKILYSPPILGFADAEYVVDTEISLYFHFNENAYLGVKYKLIHTSWDQGGDEDTDSLLLGVRLSF